MSQTLDDFLYSCEAGQEKMWQPADLVYPGTLEIELDSVQTYEARVRLMQTTTVEPEPPPMLIPGTPESREVALQCVVAARLVTIGDTVEVEEVEEAQDGGWIYRRFTSSAEINWGWAVTGKKLGSQDVRLQLQPAVEVIISGDHIYYKVSDPPMETATLATRVTVTGNPIQVIGKWWGDNTPTIVMILAALGAAVVGVIAWVGKVRKTARDARRGGDPPADDAPPRPPASPPGAAPGAGGGLPPTPPWP